MYTVQVCQYKITKKDFVFLHKTRFGARILSWRHFWRQQDLSKKTSVATLKIEIDTLKRGLSVSKVKMSVATLIITRKLSSSLTCVSNETAIAHEKNLVCPWMYQAKERP